MRNFLLFIGLLVSAAVSAEEAFTAQRLYLGGGFAQNKVAEFDEAKSGLQLFAGYNLSARYGLDARYFSLALEGGYMDTGEVDRDGLWLTPVLISHIAPSTDLLLRAGAATGHDSGPVYGIGASYRIERNMAVRVEYVEHPKAHSLQFNVVYYPWSWPFQR